MSRGRFVGLAVAVGVALPPLWLIAYWLLLRGDPDLIHSLLSTNRSDRVLLAVWPNWWLFIADPEESGIAIHMALLAGAFGTGFIEGVQHLMWRWWRFFSADTSCLAGILEARRPPLPLARSCVFVSPGMRV